MLRMTDKQHFESSRCSLCWSITAKIGFYGMVHRQANLFHCYSELDQEADKWNSSVHLFTLPPYTLESPLVVTDVPVICPVAAPKFFSYQTSGCLALFSHNSVTISNSNALHRQAGYASMGSAVMVTRLWVFFDASIHFLYLTIVETWFYISFRYTA